MNTKLLRLLPGLVCGCVLWIQAPACSAADSFGLSLSEDLVSLNAVDADLDQVLHELSRLAGFKVWISGNVPPQAVTQYFDRLSIPQSLQRLLTDSSYALVYGDDGDVAALYVLPPGQESPAMVELDTGDTRQKMLQNLLESDSIPDNVKAALLQQFSVSPTPAEQVPGLQSTEAIGKLIEALERIGSASPVTIQQLRDKLEHENSLQSE